MLNEVISRFKVFEGRSETLNDRSHRAFSSGIRVPMHNLAVDDSDITENAVRLSKGPSLLQREDLTPDLDEFWIVVSPARNWALDRLRYCTKNSPYERWIGDYQSVEV